MLSLHSILAQHQMVTSVVKVMSKYTPNEIVIQPKKLP